MFLAAEMCKFFANRNRLLPAIRVATMLVNLTPFTAELIVIITQAYAVVVYLTVLVSALLHLAANNK